MYIIIHIRGGIIHSINELLLLNNYNSYVRFAGKTLEGRLCSLANASNRSDRLPCLGR